MHFDRLIILSSLFLLVLTGSTPARAERVSPDQRFKLYMKCFDAVQGYAPGEKKTQYYFKQPKPVLVTSGSQLLAHRGPQIGLISFTDEGACFHEIPGKMTMIKGARLMLGGSTSLDVDYTFDESRHTGVVYKEKIGRPVRGETEEQRSLDSEIAKSVGASVTDSQITAIIHGPVEFDLARSEGDGEEAIELGCEDITDETVSPTADELIYKQIALRIRSLRSQRLDPAIKKAVLEKCVDAFRQLPARYLSLGSKGANLLLEMKKDFSIANGQVVRGERVPVTDGEVAR